MTQIVQEATRSLFHPDVLGLVLTTSPEMEPGIDKELAKLIDGVCLQVGQASISCRAGASSFFFLCPFVTIVSLSTKPQAAISC